MPKAPSKKHQDAMAKSLALAARGEMDWLDKAVRDAGYVLADEGIQQKDLVESVDGLTRATLSNWEAEGLRSVTNQKRKFYPAIDFIKFLYARAVKSGRPMAGSGSKDELLIHEIKNKEYQALTRQAQYEKMIETMIDKAEAERLMIGMVLEIKATLLSLPQQIAAQLEGLPSGQIRKTLEERIRWLCAEMASGKVHVPEAVSNAIDDALEAIEIDSSEQA